MKNISIALLIIASLTSCKKDKSNYDVDVANLNSNLVLYYPFNGNAADASANHINASLMNGPAFTTGHSGNANSAILLDGVNDYLQVHSSSILNNMERPYTISCWAMI